MSSKTKFTCDVCGKPISGKHQEYYKSTITITHREQDDAGETEDVTTTYHVHNDLTNHCMRKIWDILEKHRK